MSEFTKLNFPLDGEYSSDGERLPIEFFLTALPSAREVYLKLGYFSSTAIQVLAYGFAQFIANGGSMKIVTNHFLYGEDRELLSKDDPSEHTAFEHSLLRDPEWVHDKISKPGQHFLDCLRALVASNQLSIVPVMLRPARMVHYKEGVFIDDVGAEISFTGSCNFTGSGLLENGESLSISRSWISPADSEKCRNRLTKIKSIISTENDSYVYLSQHDVVDAALSLGKERSVEELLEQELLLVRGENKKFSAVLERHKEKLQEAISNYKLQPRFPFPSGPRAYQTEAYNAWVANGRCGVFAMATGTGKTITSLNCLLRDHEDTGYYQAVILVPTKALLLQWQEEVSDFNFKNVYSAFSGNKKWNQELGILTTSLGFNPKASFILIATYDTFGKDKLLLKALKFPKSTLLIADEAHNFGRPGIKSRAHEFPFSKRIALSATPKRRFDDEGNDAIERFFHDSAPYVYSFTMERAIDEGVLCPYEYHPHVIELTSDEMLQYSEISKKLSKLFDSTSGTFSNPEYAKILLLERRRIIHKAAKKLPAFAKILTQLHEEEKLSYCFVYTPEGEDLEGENLLQMYMQRYSEIAENRRAHHFTSKTENRVEVMDLFEGGTIDALFSMKCLDEGVDVPRAEVAIFCSSTGNPRQFIQRRGRVLRKHPKKGKAVIHDLVVAPDTSNVVGIDRTLEKKLMKEELTRVVYFASLSKNYYETMRSLSDLAERYELNMFALQAELAE